MLARIRAGLAQSHAQLADLAMRTPHAPPAFVHPPQDDLPAQFAAFDNDWVIGVALVLYIVEFFADKVPWIDTLWDAVHTFVRPVGGAIIAVTTLGHASPGMQALAALLGGFVATSSHLTKAGTRAIANTSPEPFSNWLLSLGEDAFVVGLSVLALKHPLAALAVTVAVLVVIFVFAAALVRALRRRFSSRLRPHPA